MSEHRDKAVMVWRFQDAPKHLRDMSTNGGDEDWLAAIPPHLKDDWIGWLDQPAFGCCCIDTFRVVSGGIVERQGRRLEHEDEGYDECGDSHSFYRWEPTGQVLHAECIGYEIRIGCHA